eukprot:gene13319-biopygen13711
MSIAQRAHNTRDTVCGRTKQSISQEVCAEAGVEKEEWVMKAGVEVVEGRAGYGGMVGDSARGKRSSRCGHGCPLPAHLGQLPSKVQCSAPPRDDTSGAVLGPTSRRHVRCSAQSYLEMTLYLQCSGHLEMTSNVQYSACLEMTRQCHLDLSNLRVAGCLAYAGSDPVTSMRTSSVTELGHCGMLATPSAIHFQLRAYTAVDLAIPDPPETPGEAARAQHDRYAPDGRDDIPAVVKPNWEGEGGHWAEDPGGSYCECRGSAAPFLCGSADYMLVIILAINLRLRVRRMDVETAWLDSELDEELDGTLPSGLEVDGCRYGGLRKALYRLKQVGKARFETGDAVVMGYDSRICKSGTEPCLKYTMTADLLVLCGRLRGQ